MSTLFSTHAWRIPWTEEPRELHSIWSESRTRLKQFSPRAHSESRRPECVDGGGGGGACVHTHVHTHTHTHMGISEHHRGCSGSGSSNAPRLQMHLKRIKSQGKAIKHVAHFKGLL